MEFENAVVEVRGATNILSNFYMSGEKSIPFEKYLFKTVEHAYQFAKAHHYGEYILAHEIRGARECIYSQRHWLKNQRGWLMGFG